MIDGEILESWVRIERKSSGNYGTKLSAKLKLPFGTNCAFVFVLSVLFVSLVLLVLLLDVEDWVDVDGRRRDLGLTLLLLPGGGVMIKHSENVLKIQKIVELISSIFNDSPRYVSKV